MLGRSSITTVNSLVIGMARPPFHAKREWSEHLALWEEDRILLPGQLVFNMLVPVPKLPVTDLSGVRRRQNFCALGTAQFRVLASKPGTRRMLLT